MGKYQYRPNQKAGAYAPGRERWLEAGHIEAVMYRRLRTDYTELDGLSDEKADLRFEADEMQSILLEIHMHSKVARASKTILLKLTMFTVPQLQAFKQFINYAIDEAIRTAEHLDRNAQEVFDAGTNALPRIYSAVPRLHVRARPESSDSSGVWIGSEIVPDLYLPSNLPLVRERDGSVADEESAPVEPSDNEAEASGTEIVGEVGGTSDSAV